MNWGITIKRSLLFLIIWYLFNYQVVALECLIKDPKVDDVSVISEEKCQNLVEKTGINLFEVKAKYDGVIELSSDALKGKVGSVTVFSSNYKQIIAQCISFNNEPISFVSKVGEVYYVTWQLKPDGFGLNWNVNQHEEKGISSASAIVATEGVTVANHTQGYDRWFVYTAEHSGQVSFSSCGQTNENTCLFVYDETAESVIGSSNFTEGTLQSRVVIKVNKGEVYYLKWSSAFTNAKYKWTIAYVEY